MAPTTDQFQPGQRVAVIQQIPQRQRVWTTRFEGTVVGSSPTPTGAWFSQGKNGHLWLDRLVLRKDDGELVVCQLDPFTHVELLPLPAVPAVASPPPPGPAAA